MGEGDREVARTIPNSGIFLVGVHHDRLHITAAEFRKDYFKWESEEIIHAGRRIVLRMLEFHDLSEPNSQKEACKIVFAIMRRISML